MSALFPHDAVVQRYLHTGKRRSGRKIVVASVLGVLAFVVVIAALPAHSSKSGGENIAAVEPAKLVSPAPPVESVATQAVAPTPPKSDVSNVNAPVGTTGMAANQPNTKPPQARVETAPIPPAPPPSVPQPAPLAAVAQAPDPVAPAANAPAQPTVAVNTAAADHTADVAAPPHAAARLARKSGHRLTAAGKRNRLARQRAPQPTLVRVYDLPDGRRVYQRVTGGEVGLGYPGGELRRVYLAPVDPSVD